MNSFNVDLLKCHHQNVEGRNNKRGVEIRISGCLVGVSGQGP